MALLDRLRETHTAGEFRRAVRLRFAEADRAVEAGDRLIGLYLAGYSAEMTLKAAYFRIVGTKLTEPISLRELNTVKDRYKAQSGSNWPGNLHNLIAWADLLIAERQIRGVPLSKPLSKRLSGQVQRIAANWREDLRYHENRPRPSELSATFQSIEWLFANESQLVR